ncbi:MAG: hypothetical protein R3C32_07215 [Chloroflexota bacterium]
MRIAGLPTRTGSRRGHAGAVRPSAGVRRHVGRVASGSARIHCWSSTPSESACFSVRGADGVLAAGPRHAEAMLRRAYPQAEVRPRSLSGETVEVWYVYRDGRWVLARRTEGPWASWPRSSAKAPPQGRARAAGPRRSYAPGGPGDAASPDDGS